MKDCNFKSLIIDCYNDSKIRTFTKDEFGMKVTYGNFLGTISITHLKRFNKRLPDGVHPNR